MAEIGGSLDRATRHEEEEIETFDDSRISNQRLIPSLPDEIAVECLLRIPHKYHSTMKLVCHGWRSVFSHPSFFSDRRRLGAAEHLIFLVQPLPSTPPSPIASPSSGAEFTDVEDSQAPAKAQLRSRHGPPLYSIGVYNLTQDTWNRLTMSRPRNSPNTAVACCGEIRIPTFCQAAAVPGAGRLLLIGGWDPETLEPVSDVYVIDLVAGTWKRGCPMRTVRSFFACAVVAPPSSTAAGGWRVWVAGGHDGQKNALRSAEVYDVTADEWAAAPEMAEERDECYGISHGSNFWVVSGYGTDSQGRFRSDAEFFDSDANRWVKVDDVWPLSGSSPRSTVVGSGDGGGDGRRWWCLGGGGEVREFDWEEMRWKVVAGGEIEIPKAFIGSSSLSLCAVDLGGGNGWFVMGSGCRGGGGVEERGVFVVERGEGRVWKEVAAPPPGLRGFPFSASHLLI